MRPLARILLLFCVMLVAPGAAPARPLHPTAPTLRPAPDPAPFFDPDLARVRAALAHPAQSGSAAPPLMIQEAAPAPQLDNLVVGNLTTTQASASFSSDLPASTLFYAANPLTEFSSASLTTSHIQTLSGLAPGTAYRLRAMAVTADLGLGALPDVVFTTAQAPAPGGAPQISAGVADLVSDPTDPSAVFVVLSIRNTGTGDASDVTLTGLNAPAGWMFTHPLPLPLDLGGLGRGASAALLTRVSSSSVTPAPPPLLTGAGTVAVTGLAPQPFTIGGTVPVLFLTKAASVTSAHQGDTVSYTVTVTNRGQGSATGVFLTDTLPAGLTFQTASGGATPQNGTLTWTAGTLAAGAAASVTIGAQVAASAAVGATITNVAQTYSAEIPAPVASAGASVTVTAPPPPQLQLTKAANQTVVQPGQSILYTMTLANVGAGPATNVQITDVVPAGTSVTGVSPGGAAVNTTTLGWSISSLPAGGSTSVSFQVQVAAVAAGTTISNVAQATAAEAPTPVSSNQGSPVVVQVVAPPAPPPPQLSLTKSVDKPSVAAGDTLTYTLAYSNAGSQPFTATITDPLPAGLQFVGSFSGGQLNGTAVQFNLGALAPGATGTVSFTAQVNASLAAGTVITNQAQISGPGLAQPLASNAVSSTVVAPTVPPTVPPVSTASPFAGTWSSLPLTGAPPATPHASLTVDAQGKFTVWARSADGQTVANSAQGTLNPDGSYDVTSPDGAVHFTGQIAADHQTAMMTAAAAGLVPFTITAPQRPAVTSLPGGLSGTFEGAGAAANGDRLQIRLSVDPGGNATVEADVLGSTAARQFATLQASVAPGTGGLVLTSPDNMRQVATITAVNNVLTLTYNYVLAETGYQNTFQLPLAAGP